jgi:hypothetical protein
LLAGEVNLESDDGRVSAVHGKPEQTPASLVGGEVAAILVLANLVDSIGVDGDFRHGFIWALVNILVEVLYSLQRAAQLDVNVGVISFREVGIIRNDPAVIKRHRTAPVFARLQNLPSIISSSVHRVLALFPDGLLAEGLRESLGALPVPHAGSVRIVPFTARPVDHIINDNVIELRIDVFVGNLSTAGSIDVSSRIDPICIVEDKEDVSMGEASLLKLNNIAPADSSAHNAMLRQVLNKGVYLNLKYLDDNIRAVVRSLPGPKLR